MDAIRAAMQQEAMLLHPFSNTAMMGWMSSLCMQQQFNSMNALNGRGHDGGYMQQGQQRAIEDGDCDIGESPDTLFVSNLDQRVTVDMLYEIFIQAGPLKSVRIPMENGTGRRRTFGFVTYEHKCAVPFALELYKGLELFQKSVGIKSQHSSKSKAARNGSGGGAAGSGDKGGDGDVHVWQQHNADHSSLTTRGRHSLQDNKQIDSQRFDDDKQYNRSNNNNNMSNDLLRRSDSNIIDRNRTRTQQDNRNHPYHYQQNRQHHQKQQHHRHNQYQQQHQNNSGGGNRRSDQRNSQGGRRSKNCVL